VLVVVLGWVTTMEEVVVSTFVVVLHHFISFVLK
jgi:hypothetical protein